MKTKADVSLLPTAVLGLALLTAAPPDATAALTSYDAAGHHVTVDGELGDFELAADPLNGDGNTAGDRRKCATPGAVTRSNLRTGVVRPTE